jgi:nitrile hydratase
MPHDHPHDHSHGHHGHDHHGTSASGHPFRPDNDTALTYWQIMEIAVRELMVEKGITTPAEIQAQIERMDRRSPADGAKVVARAWTDPDFKARLIADGSRACESMGFPIDGLKLRTVREPRRVLAEFGLDLADDVQVRVHDSTADMRYLVLPARPAGTEGWDEARLAAIVTRDCMIGTAVQMP